MNPRTYLVGLPVVVTVSDDGSVTYWVDTSETDTAIFDNEQENPPTEEQMLADQALIQADHSRRYEEKRQRL